MAGSTRGSVGESEFLPATPRGALELAFLGRIAVAGSFMSCQCGIVFLSSLPHYRRLADVADDDDPALVVRARALMVGVGSVILAEDLFTQSFKHQTFLHLGTRASTCFQDSSRG